MDTDFSSWLGDARFEGVVGYLGLRRCIAADKDMRVKPILDGLV